MRLFVSFALMTLTLSLSILPWASASPLPFSIVILPDTQVYSDYYPKKFTGQTQWIADHKQELNIQMVLHEGDVVSHADDPMEWDNAVHSMGIWICYLKSYFNFRCMNGEN